MGYFFLFLLGFTPAKIQISSLVILLLGYFLAFALYPLPDAAFDYSQTGVTPDWLYNLSGFEAHWNKNTNLAWAFDRWFLQLFPRESPFLFNEGGYTTLSFIPTLGTMILGLLAGKELKNNNLPHSKIKNLLLIGAALFAAGWLLNALHICPTVKRIWTPAWTLYSGGMCFLLLTLFYWSIDVLKTTKWYFVLLVIGANSIAAYIIAHTIDGFIASSLSIHLGKEYAAVFGVEYAPLIRGLLILFFEWLILFWMYRKRIFIKI